MVKAPFRIKRSVIPGCWILLRCKAFDTRKETILANNALQLIPWRKAFSAGRVEPCEMKYHTIYADPPWSEFGGGQIKRGADRHYPLMHTLDIKNLNVRGYKVHELAEKDAHLYLWATNNKLLDALEVVKAWGFEYKTLITWAKDRFGLGQYYRGQTEHCIFATRGVCPYRLGENGKRAQGRTLIDGFDAPRGEHSVKPDVMRQWIESVSPGPYLELFARQRVEGWDSFGNEVQS